MTSFDAVVDEYERGRPDYPRGVYDALEPLRDLLVLEGGAGTGIATRMLLERRARVVPFDLGLDVLQRAVTRTPGLPAVVADGAILPFRDTCADLICFAQAWHWLDEGERAAEAARVLRPGGRWAAWWSHARADGEPWFDAYWDAVEAASVARRYHRDTDWGAELQVSGLFDVRERVTVPWLRKVSIAVWLLEERSKSYIAALAETERNELLSIVGHIISEHFPDGQMLVPYETWLWVAERRGSP